jgi:hypothetical protein
MSIVNDIANIVATKYPDATYYFNSWLKANLASFKNTIDEMEEGAPLIVLYNDIPKDNEVQQNTSILSSENIKIRVLVKGALDDNDPHMNQDIEYCETIVNELMLQIYFLKSIRLLGNEKQKFRVTPIFKSWNSILNGVQAEANFKYNKVENICPS